MNLRVRDWMQADVRWIAASARVPEIERVLAEAAISGAPVLDAGGRLCGVISLADIVRRLAVAHGQAAELSDYYRDPGSQGIQFPDGQSLDDIAATAGVNVDHLRAVDLMSREVLCVDADDSLGAAAGCMVRHDVNRLPVMAGDRLCGVISTMDMARAMATFDTGR